VEWFAGAAVQAALVEDGGDLVEGVLIQQAGAPRLQLRLSFVADRLSAL